MMTITAPPPPPPPMVPRPRHVNCRRSHLIWCALSLSSAPPTHMHVHALQTQVKDTLSSLYAHVSQLNSGPITAGGGDDDGDKDDEDTAYVSDNFSIVSK